MTFDEFVKSLADNAWQALPEEERSKLVYGQWLAGFKSGYLTASTGDWNPGTVMYSEEQNEVDRDALEGIVAQLIKRRKEMGFTQGMIGERLNRSVPAISSWEGGTKVPPVPGLQAWARCLGMRLVIELAED